MSFYRHVTIRISKGRTAVIVLRAAYSRGTTFIPRDWDWWYASITLLLLLSFLTFLVLILHRVIAEDWFGLHSEGRTRNNHNGKKEKKEKKRETTIQRRTSLGRLVYEYHYHRKENIIKQYSIKSNPPKTAYKIRTNTRTARTFRVGRGRSSSQTDTAEDDDASVMLATTAAPACLFNFMVY